jgi:putative tryptophan/tyrosine transport system substrate-binding protein
VEGRNLTIEWSFSAGKADQLPRLVTERVDLPVDLIVAIATPPALAAAAATGTIPIVFIQVADPVALGIVPSFARPIANVTGMSNMLTDFRTRAIITATILVCAAQPSNSIQDETHPLGCRATLSRLC